MNLGACYEKGDGITADINEALKCYIDAAELGSADAQANILVYYSNIINYYCNILVYHCNILVVIATC